MSNFQTPDIAETRLITHAKIAAKKCAGFYRVVKVKLHLLNNYSKGVIEILNGISIGNFREREVLFNKVYDKWEAEKNNIYPAPTSSSSPAERRVYNVRMKHLGANQIAIDKIMAEIDQFFYNNKKYVSRKKEADLKHHAWNIVGGALGGVLGVGITELPRTVRDTYTRFQRSSSQNKARMIGSGLMKLTGAITESPLAFMSAARLDSAITTDEEIKKQNVSIAKSINSGPSILRVKAAGGFKGVVNKETHFTVGENGPEAVQVSPLGKAGTTSVNGKAIENFGDSNKSLISVVTTNNKLLQSIYSEIHRGNEQYRNSIEDARLSRKETKQSKSPILKGEGKSNKAEEQSSFGMPSTVGSWVKFIGGMAVLSKMTGDVLKEAQYPDLPDKEKKVQHNVQSIAGGGGLSKGFTDNLKRSGQEFNNLPTATKTSWTAKELGAISAQQESGGNAGAISDGKGYGGFEYGKYQLSSKKGNLKGFLKKTGYDKQFKGITIGSSAFNKKWKAIAKSDSNFENAQDEFGKSEYYDKGIAELKNKGIDLSNRGLAVQQAIWSTMTQYGNTNVIEKALGDKSKLNSMSDNDIVYAIQNYKYKHADTLFRSSTPEVVKDQKYNRIPSEYNQLTGQPIGKKMPKKTSVDKLVQESQNFSNNTRSEPNYKTQLESALMDINQTLKQLNMGNVSVSTNTSPSNPNISIFTGDSGYPSRLSKSYGGS